MMQLVKHSARQFASAMLALLPPGQVWQWPETSFGDYLMMAFAQELTRIDEDLQLVMDRAIEIHRPAQSNWHINAYRAEATKALGTLTETMPRKAAGIGMHIGDRLWSHNAPNTTFTVPLVQVDHLVGPARIGMRIGDALWGPRSRYIMRVRYYRSVVNPDTLFAALNAFKQAHVYLWFEDITGVGGEVFYAQN